jgi:hypothetical protein
MSVSPILVVAYFFKTGQERRMPKELHPETDARECLQVQVLPALPRAVAEVVDASVNVSSIFVAA